MANEQWLKSGDWGADYCRQDQGLATRFYHSNNIKDDTKSLPRMSGKFDDSVDHIICGYPELAKTEYAASYIHWKVCLSCDIKTTDKWSEHKPETVVEKEQATILWNMPIHTDRE